MTDNWIAQLDLLIRSGTPLIWIRSHEEERVETLLRQTSERLPDRTLTCWDFVGGLSGALGQEQLGARQPMAVLQWLQERSPSSPRPGPLSPTSRGSRQSPATSRPLSW